MALRNGLLVHGPTHWAAAVRTRDGGRRWPAGRKPRLRWRAVERVPGLRGVTEAGRGVRGDPAGQARAARGAAADAGRAHARRGGARRRRRRRCAAPAAARTLGREAAVAAMSAAARRCSRCEAATWPPYHGVEHKAIAAYEQDGDAADATKEHDRCGSNLVAPMLAPTAPATSRSAARACAARPPRARSRWARWRSRSRSSRWAERHPDTVLARWLRRPGLRDPARASGTREPSAEQLEVGRAALDEILRVEGGAVRVPRACSSRRLVALWDDLDGSSLVRRLRGAVDQACSNASASCSGTASGPRAVPAARERAARARRRARPSAPNRRRCAPPARIWQEHLPLDPVLGNAETAAARESTLSPRLSPITESAGRAAQCSARLGCRRRTSVAVARGLARAACRSSTALADQPSPARRRRPRRA